MPTFAETFRLQAASDLQAYESLAGTTLPVSHRLHYLQMWLEKLSKAYLWLPGTNEENLRTLHQVVGRVLPRLVLERWRRLDAYQQRPDMVIVRSLCREVDLLHPQIRDNGRRPDNVEYPWTASGQNFVPAEHKFSLTRRLYTNPGRALIKASVQLTKDPSILLG